MEGPCFNPTIIEEGPLKPETLDPFFARPPGDCAEQHSARFPDKEIFGGLGVVCRLGHTRGSEFRGLGEFRTSRVRF